VGCAGPALTRRLSDIDGLNANVKLRGAGSAFAGCLRDLPCIVGY
jgi:hypothetical protein